MNPDLTIHVNGLGSELPIERNDVVRAVRATFRAEGIRAGEISITFLDREAIAELNRRYLGREGPTDVLAFNLGEGRSVLADVYLCPQIARQSAQDYDVPWGRELLRLIVHGMLHIAGYDHPEGPERMESGMYRRQEEILEDLN